MTDFVWCKYCDCALKPDDRKCPYCGAPRPEHPRFAKKREWPQYERAAVALSTAAFPAYASTSAPGSPTVIFIGSTGWTSTVAEDDENL